MSINFENKIYSRLLLFTIFRNIKKNKKFKLGYKENFVLPIWFLFYLHLVNFFYVVAEAGI